ncbi:hypothetical protein CENSYa_0137 [Cenarchaeum symbiosum A]|uniref:Uncharacterized protein n=1 Tax=Cenarchaeum symbiosum (strain A) TaxID=414004 RepID=A0RTW5_CENSY|nr:hypothetical protein CENSYa_0137 [Cenarchaeum symbiosum A]
MDHVQVFSSHASVGKILYMPCLRGSRASVYTLPLRNLPIITPIRPNSTMLTTCTADFVCMQDPLSHVDVHQTPPLYPRISFCGAL